MQTVDTIVIGAGIAGASVAWQLVQPGAAGQSASVLLDQNTNETLQRADDGAVQHDGAMALAILAHEFRIETLGHVRVHLDRSALPFATQRIFQGVLDLRAVEGAFARLQFVCQLFGFECGDQCALTYVFVSANFCHF